MSKQPPPAPTASAIGPCPTIIQIVGRPGTGSLPSTIAPPDHPLNSAEDSVYIHQPERHDRRFLTILEHLLCYKSRAKYLFQQISVFFNSEAFTSSDSLRT